MSDRDEALRLVGAAFGRSHGDGIDVAIARAVDDLLAAGFARPAVDDDTALCSRAVVIAAATRLHADLCAGGFECARDCERLARSLSESGLLLPVGERVDDDTVERVARRMAEDEAERETGRPWSARASFDRYWSEFLTDAERARWNASARAAIRELSGEEGK